MKCFMPVRFYRGDDNSVHHNPSKFFVKSEGFHPCGRCLACKMRRATDNAIRMVHESKFHEQNCFLTLTYSDSKLPSDYSLRYKDVSNFMKRLRRSLESTKYDQSLSYYRVGEYGSDFSRPHYHMVLFGFDFSDSIEYKGVLNSKVKSGSKSDRIYYKSSFATDVWNNGFVDIGEVDFATCLYTAKYVTKKLYSGDPASYDLRETERSSSSKRRPIGSSWIEKFYTDVYPQDSVVFDGKNYPPPRFYDTWLSREVPELYKLVKEKREESSLSLYPDYRDLHAKQSIALQRQSTFLRDGCAPNLSQDFYQLERKCAHISSLKSGKGPVI